MRTPGAQVGLTAPSWSEVCQAVLEACFVTGSREAWASWQADRHTVPSRSKGLGDGLGDGLGEGLGDVYITAV